MSTNIVLSIGWPKPKNVNLTKKKVGLNQEATITWDKIDINAPPFTDHEIVLASASNKTEHPSFSSQPVMESYAVLVPSTFFSPFLEKRVIPVL